MRDVLIAGAGPAGCIAAILLARAGARVLLVDRARFPRHKLCGDTLNPGARAILRRLGVSAGDEGLPISGMLVTGPEGVRVAAHYPAGVTGRAIVRRDLDYSLLRCAVESGAEMEEGFAIRGPVVDDRGRVTGVEVAGTDGRARAVHAPLVIAADGRESRLARALGLACHPRRPRRWAVGAYFEGVAATGDCGEMHVRAARYIGVAPLPRGLTNVCVVTADRAALRQPASLVASAIRGDAELADRFSSARMVGRPVMLGPLAVICRTPGCAGLLLAGDAAGFIDPMTGDGLRFAIRGAELAAAAAVHALDSGDPHAHLRLAAARRREFASKWRFNRVLRRLTGSVPAIRAAELATRMSGWPMSRVIRYAGDVSVA